jgi:hypothetical protein
MTPRDRYDRVVLNASVAAIFVLLFFSISSLLLPGVAFCHDYHSYINDRGTPVLTDNFKNDVVQRYE